MFLLLYLAAAVAGIPAVSGSSEAVVEVITETIDGSDSYESSSVIGVMTPVGAVSSAEGDIVNVSKMPIYTRK